MPSKRSWIVVLVGVNLALLAALVHHVYSLPAAFAQAGIGRGDFITVTAKPAGQSYEVLYVLDVPARQLHALYPAAMPRNKLTAVAPRELSKDFAGK